MYKAQGAILARQPRGLTPWQLGTWALPLVLSTTQRPGAVTDSCPLSIGELGRLPQNHAKSWGSCSQSDFVITWINHTSSIFKPNTVFVRRDLRHCLHLSAEAIHILNANGEKAWSWRHPSLRMTQKDPKSEVGDLLQHVQHSAAQPVSVTWMYRPYDAWELLWVWDAGMVQATLPCGFPVSRIWRQTASVLTNAALPLTPWIETLTPFAKMQEENAKTSVASVLRVLGSLPWEHLWGPQWRHGAIHSDFQLLRCPEHCNLGRFRLDQHPPLAAASRDQGHLSWLPNG